MQIVADVGRFHGSSPGVALSKPVVVKIVSLLLFLCVLSGCPSSHGGRSYVRPNVILLVMDTTRADRCSVLGYSRPTTPNLEALAKESALFTSAWSPAGWTGPAHASLFTGLRPENHGYTGGQRYYLPPCETLASRLGAAGYRTGAFSNNPLVAADNGLDQGFSNFYPLFEDSSRPYPFAASAHAEALDWIRAARRDGEPFFLFINDIEPHFPYLPPLDWQERFVDPSVPHSEVEWARNLTTRTLDGHNLGLYPLSPETIRVLSDLYDAEVACLDQEVGRFVEALRKEGVLENTVLVVLGDHGEEFNEHGLLTHIASLHAAIRHVPLLVRYPPAFAPGSVIRQTVRLEDVPPTILELCGAPLPDGLDGLSLLSVSPGRVARARCGSVTPFLMRLRTEFPRSCDDSHLAAEISAVFDGRHHLIDDSLGRERLYDLWTDPAETTDLASDEPEMRMTLTPLLPALDGAPDHTDPR